MMTQTLSPTPAAETLSRSDKSLSLMIAEAMDSRLLHYARTDQTFTISDVRDHLLMRPELADLASNALRYRVRERMKTLERNGLAERVGLLGKRRVIYRLKLEEAEEQADTSPATPPSSPISPNGIADFLADERDRLRSEMQAALGEAEHYRSLLQHFPEERGRISPLLETSIERGSRLKGQWDANTKLRATLCDREANA